MTTAKQSTRMRKVICRDEVCGCTLRMTYGQAARCGLPTCGCGSIMVFADIADQVRLGDDAIDVHPEYERTIMREMKAAARGDRIGLERNVLQCGGCRKFLKRIDQTCGCGFTNDIRGKRNHGGYLGLLADGHSDPMPF